MGDPGRVGVMVGTGVAGVDQILDTYDVFKARGYSRMKPYAVPGGIPNIPAFMLAREFQCLGPNNTTTTACAAGTQAIGEGAEYIRRGHADVVLAGGTEAVIHPLVVATFSVMRATPFNFNDQPEKASRPFNIDREGFVLSEGAAILVLESLDHALSRGAHIYAEILGHASTSDGYDIAAMLPDGAGAIRAMRDALRYAGVQPSEIDYINAHGTSTPLNDKTETSAIKSVFSEYAYQVPVSSTKSMLGHAMGASGAIEALICVLAINTGVIPPTINYDNPDPECDLNYVPNTAIQKSVEITLSNSFGLGGQNACLVLKSYTGDGSS
jgi:3-oxoacyl-(acyl-carrier-protein) synthase